MMRCIPDLSSPNCKITVTKSEQLFLPREIILLGSQREGKRQILIKPRIGFVRPKRNVL